MPTTCKGALFKRRLKRGAPSTRWAKSSWLGKLAERPQVRVLCSQNLLAKVAKTTKVQALNLPHLRSWRPVLCQTNGVVRRRIFEPSSTDENAAAPRETGKTAKARKLPGGRNGTFCHMPPAASFVKCICFWSQSKEPFFLRVLFLQVQHCAGAVQTH